MGGTAPPQLLITDFGLSMNRGVDWHTNKVGSPAYVAPEVLLHHVYTPACDVWAMGVILYILLVGFPPFYGDSDSDVRVHAAGWRSASTVDPACALPPGVRYDHTWSPRIPVAVLGRCVE